MPDMCQPALKMSSKINLLISILCLMTMPNAIVQNRLELIVVSSRAIGTLIHDHTSDCLPIRLPENPSLRGLRMKTALHYHLISQRHKSFELFQKPMITRECEIVRVTGVNRTKSTGQTRQTYIQ